jgi:Fe-S cluster biogenesis protein NfuA
MRATPGKAKAGAVRREGRPVQPTGYGGVVLEKEVKEALELIRPRLQADGGDVEFVGLEDGVVKVRLTGACGGCPMAALTLKNGIERFLKDRVPGVKAVEAAP